MKRKTIAIVAGLAVFAAVSASAATLGGITSGDVGANSGVVSSQINSGVAVTFTTAYDAALGYYKVTGATLTVTGTDNFAVGSNIAVEAKGAGGAALGELTATVGTAGKIQNLSFAGTVAAHDVQGVSVVVNGGATVASLTSVL